MSRRVGLGGFLFLFWLLFCLFVVVLWGFVIVFVFAFILPTRMQGSFTVDKQPGLCFQYSGVEQTGEKGTAQRKEGREEPGLLLRAQE